MYYNKKINVQKSDINDMVYLLKEPVKNKLTNQYAGFYRILKKYSSNNVNIDLSNNRTKIIHKNKIKKAN